MIASLPADRLGASAKLTKKHDVKRYQAPGAGRSKAVGVPVSIRREHRQAPVVALALAGVAVVAAGPPVAAPLCALAGLIGADRGAVTDTVAAGVHQAAYHTGGSPVALQAGMLVPAAVGGGTWSAVSGIMRPRWYSTVLGRRGAWRPGALSSRRRRDWLRVVLSG